MELQKFLDGIHDAKMQQRAAQIGITAINDRWNPTLKRLAHADSAYFIDDGLTVDSSLNPSQQFGEIILKGSTPRLSCIDARGRLVVSLPFFNSVILGPQEDITLSAIDSAMEGYDRVLLPDTTQVRPLFVPVEGIRCITFAA